MCRYKDLAAVNAEVGQAALALYCATVRATLFVCKGYECQEKEGVFMTAFPGPIKALEWAVTLQMALLRYPHSTCLPSQPAYTLLPCAQLLKGARLPFEVFANNANRGDNLCN